MVRRNGGIAQPAWKFASQSGQLCNRCSYYLLHPLSSIAAKASRAIPPKFPQADLRGIPDTEWVNLLVGTEMPKSYAISRGPKMADEIAGVFTTLTPLYAAVALPFIGNKD
jgi:hypothetical protein